MNSRTLKSTDCFSLEQSFTVWSRCRAGVGPRFNHKRYWNWMDLCFNWRSVYLVSTVNIWGYGSWAAMSHKTTTNEGTGIGSGCVIEGLIVRWWWRKGRWLIVCHVLDAFELVKGLIVILWFACVSLIMSCSIPSLRMLDLSICLHFVNFEYLTCFNKIIFGFVQLFHRLWRTRI